jgi:hypothetical protein
MKSKEEPNLKHTLSIAALLVAGLSVSAVAGDKPSLSLADANAVGIHSNSLSAVANSEQVLKLLRSQGFVNVSQLARDAHGRWSGVATKDGERRMVSVSIPAITESSSTN